MKFTVFIDENCEQALHQSTSGDSFALDLKSKYAIFGGHHVSTLVDLNDPKNIIKQYQNKTPLKWFVSNYDWDPLTPPGSERFLQTRNKLIEVVNCETSDVTTFRGHGREINDAKWSPLRRNIMASSSADCNISLWNSDVPKPTAIIPSIGEPDILSWSKQKENILAASCNNDIRIYDIRKTSSALRYISNAHTKKIYSLDWCANEEILLSSSKDRNIKLWNFNMRNQKFMEKILEDFPCWKAKFTPFGLCFAVIPTCLSPPKAVNFVNEHMSPVGDFTNLPFTDINNTIKNKTNLKKTSDGTSSLSINLQKGSEDFSCEMAYDMNNSQILNPLESKPNSNENSSNNTMSRSMSENNNNNNNKTEPTTALLICQITSFDEAKIYKFITNSTDMLLNFDFYPKNDKFKIVSWSQHQHLTQHSIDISQLTPKEIDKPTTTTIVPKIDEEITTNVKPTTTATSSLQIQPTTQNSSRKSSFSEYGLATPPNMTSVLSSRVMNERESINLNDLVGHDFLIRNPKCFGAKFSGLPEQFIIFPNEGATHLKTQKDHDNLQFTKRFRSNTNSKKNINKYMYSKLSAKRSSQTKVYIYNISQLLGLSRDFAEQYQISSTSLKKSIEQNISTAISFKRFDIVRIWELIKFVTYNNIEKFSLNPDHGRPWSCSTFGRSLVTNIIDNFIKSNDIQSAVMIISKLKNHDMNMIPIASTVNRRSSKIHEKNFFHNSSSFNATSSQNGQVIEKAGSGSSDFTKHHMNLGLIDPQRLTEFDTHIKLYCEILYQWGLLNKRIEMLEFLNEKPSDYDDKFECNIKCTGPFLNSWSKKANGNFLICSICEVPVKGMSIYCVICGHGGHYDHLIEWFKRHEDCPVACGCRCVDYL